MTIKLPANYPTFMTSRRAFFFLLFLTISVTATGKDRNVSKPKWFTSETYKTVSILKYKSISDKTVVKSVTIGDQTAISNLVRQIKMVSSDGGEMVKPGKDASFSMIHFWKQNSTDRDTIEILNNRLKTPSTGFNAQISPSEKEVLATLETILAKTGNWFSKENYDSVKVTKYRSLGDPSKTREILTDDAKFITRLIRRINSVPADGEKMKSWADSTAHIVLEFKSGSNTQKIELYDGKLKTPSTGFNAENQDELSIAKDLETLLSPALGKALLKVTGVEQKLAGLTIDFKGTETSQSDGRSSRGPTMIDTFVIRDSKGQTQSITSSAGQTAYEPIDFKTDGKSYRLNVTSDSYELTEVKSK